MQPIFLIIMFFVLLVANGEAAEIFPLLQLTFAKDDQEALSIVKDFEGKEVSIQGFLYRSPNGAWIISGEPNLKSCCAGSKDKSMKQIVLEGYDGPESHRPIKITGLFKIEEQSLILTHVK